MNGGVATPSGRAPALDRARGIAVLAMIVYHFAWDLSHFGLIDAEVATAGGWKRFAQVIAASFLFISGLSLHLATAKGFDRRAFLRRLGLVAASAGLVTAATVVSFPQSYVFFGILHCIAVSSVLSLAFVSRPALASALAGAAIIALPLAVRSAAFEAPWFVWLGLGEQAPRANDYVPLFPWAGFVLFGLAAGKVFGARLARRSAPDGALSRIGRHSLMIYLLHQPILFGGLALGVQLGALPDKQAEIAITRACAVECQVSGAAPTLCASACRCASEELRRLPLWRNLVRDALTFEERQRADAVSRACYQDAVRASPRKP